MGKKIRDAWAELWVNSLLSNPLTHVVNVSANFGFKTLKVAEYAIAATLPIAFCTFITSRIFGNSFFDKQLFAKEEKNQNKI